MKQEYYIDKTARIHPTAIIYPDVKIGENVNIGPYAIIYPHSIINSNVNVGPYCIIGEPTAKYYKNQKDYSFKKTEIGANSIIRSNSIFYEGSIVGEGLNTGHHVTVRENSKIGKCCSIGTLGDIQGDVQIGNYVRIHSNVFVCELTIIKDYVWLLPNVVITNDKYPPMDTCQGCFIDEYAIIAANATLLPGVRIGKNALVAASSLVSKDVKEESFVKGFPAQEIGSVKDIRDKNGNVIYPWKSHLIEYRGYPWQVKNDLGE